MIAQLELVKPEFLMQAVALAGVAVLAYFQWRQATQSKVREISPQPLAMRQVADYVTQVECDKTHEAVSDRLEKLEMTVDELRTALNQLDKADEQRSSEIHKRLNHLDEIVGQMPDRVVTLLLNTKQLR